MTVVPDVYDMLPADALPKILSGTCLEALLHGNLTSQEALSLAKQAQHTLTQSSSAQLEAGAVPADQRPVDRILQLPAGQPTLHRSASDLT